MSATYPAYLVQQLADRIPALLTPDLLSPAYRKLRLDYPGGVAECPATFGHCYVAAETLFWLLGGKASGFTPYTARDAQGTHWYLVGGGGIVDPTASQYTSRGATPPYAQGRGCGFLTKQPSKRAAVLLDRLRAELKDTKIFTF